ncbi:transposable element Tcb2 transposase [Trichonephila clavipes]|uniref:Transposable element Tcb2 transposase n=1 Tax=Trichonephila clavipes TaxID=2585209 RepID=A0A8X6VBF1_TRICX|nr:transposable element Tcb2 transposase [Trichonephila clavipes]
MIGKLEERRTVTSAAAEFGINKSVVSRASEAFQTTEADGSQQLSLLSNSLQQWGDKCRGLLWPDAFTKGAYSLAVLNAASRLKLTTDAIVYSGAESTKTGQLINRREIGARFYPSDIKERHHYGGPGVLVWGGIVLNGRTELHIFDRGSVIGDHYCEELFLPHVRLFRGAIGPDFIFIDDNARPHRNLAVEELLEREDITRMDWAAYSPDLNPIEHVWDALERRIASSGEHPTTQTDAD